MNDIHEASSNFKTILYADDINLISLLCLFSDSASAQNMIMEEIQSMGTSVGLHISYTEACVHLFYSEDLRIAKKESNSYKNK